MTWRASREARKTTGPAMSSGVAMRPSGMPASASFRPGPDSAAAVMSVSTQPGATELTRTRGASSTAQERVAAIIAPLLAA